MRKRTISKKQELKSALKDEWKKIATETTTKLVNSMHNRLNAVLESKGGPTKY